MQTQNNEDFFIQ